tara:strand:- start:794 stop:1360 length:567 start_codon:yes stop_codon:yes gene_type:complete
MDSVIARVICGVVEASQERAHIVAAVGSVSELQQLMERVGPALARTLTKTTTECKHLLSLFDDDFREKRRLAIVGGVSWKDRGRDRKGQLFRMRMRDGQLMGWSADVHTWVVVLPFSLQTVLCNWLQTFYQQCDETTKAAYAKYEQALTRDYAATVGERATERGLFDVHHRRALDGRRNHFVKVPKAL